MAKQGFNALEGHRQCGSCSWRLSRWVWESRRAGRTSKPRRIPLTSAKTAQTSGQKAASAVPAKSCQDLGPAQERDKLASSSLAAGKRDPFKLPEVCHWQGRWAGEGVMESRLRAGVLPPGERGLLISQLKLEGVVREQTANKMIAVVTNETRRAYFLH